MPIIPQDKRTRETSLVYTYNLAALDLPVPDVLLNRQDEREWAAYSECLPPARGIEKFAETIDQFLSILPETQQDAENMTSAEKLAVYSKWNAAQITSIQAISKKIGFTMKPAQADAFKSDLSRTVFYVVELLKNVQSPLADAWEKRQARLHEKYCDKDYETSAMKIIYSEQNQYRQALDSQAQTPLSP